eukprot:TRINITY_DN174_c0_g2_i1.p1 TRINITY_DN174_c0_g2~~TRINITY_DN174_c0_g2_i1.p1  ORF type:complete len:488 (-),score=82.15 TRINITY_DN174_c0_g2_i1:790-2253(-)
MSKTFFFRRTPRRNSRRGGYCDGSFIAEHYEKQCLPRRGICNILMNICVNVENRLKAAEAGAIEATLELMKLHCKNRKVAAAGTALLGNIGSHNDARQKAADCGAVKAVCVAFREFPRSEHLAKEAMRFLINIATESTLSRIMKDGGVKAVVKAMRAYPQIRAVQNNGAKVLYLFGLVPEHRPKIGEAGGILALVLGTKEFPTDKELQENLITAIQALLLDHPTNKELLVKAGGIEAVLTTMRRFSNYQEILAVCCLIFGSLGRIPELREEVRNTTALEEILAAMTAHPHYRPLQENGCYTLVDFVLSGETRDKVIAMGGMSIVMTASRNHLKKEGLQTFAAAVLQNFIYCVNDHKQKLINAGGIDLVMDIFKEHPENDDIVDSVLSLLVSLCEFDGASGDRVLDLGLLDIVSCRLEHLKEQALARCTRLLVHLRNTSRKWNEKPKRVFLRKVKCLLRSGRNFEYQIIRDRLIGLSERSPPNILDSN